MNQAMLYFIVLLGVFQVPSTVAGVQAVSLDNCHDRFACNWGSVTITTRLLPGCCDQLPSPSILLVDLHETRWRAGLAQE